MAFLWAFGAFFKENVLNLPGGGFFIAVGVDVGFHTSVCFADTFPLWGRLFRANTQIRPYGAETNIGALWQGRILYDP